MPADSHERHEDRLGGGRSAAVDGVAQVCRADDQRGPDQNPS